jgi:hypothetical protein
MFRSVRTKIISPPEQEEIVLEVPTQDVQVEQVVALDFVTVLGHVDFVYYGSLTDYDGKVYEFEWDNDKHRLIRLMGPTVNVLVWNQATTLLLEALVEVKTEDTLLSVKQLIAQGIGSLESRLSSLEQKLQRPMVPAPVVQQVVEKPVEVPKVKTYVEPVEEQMVDIDETDITANALKFLQTTQQNNLEVDYLSL